MSLGKLLRSGFWLTVNFAATLALFYTCTTLFQRESWILTLDTLAQLLTTFLYSCGFNIHFGLRKVPRSITNLLNGQLTTKDGAVQHGSPDQPHTHGLPNEAPPNSPSSQVVASVVGWREDPHWYAQCLDSVATNWNCDVLIAGIDGNDSEDENMVDVFRTACVI